MRCTGTLAIVAFCSIAASIGVHGDSAPAGAGNASDALVAAALVKEGQAVAIKGDFDGATVLFQKALARDPKHAAAFYSIAQVALKKELTTTAVSNFWAYMDVVAPGGKLPASGPLREQSAYVSGKLLALDPNGCKVRSVEQKFTEHMKNLESEAAKKNDVETRDAARIILNEPTVPAGGARTKFPEGTPAAPAAGAQAKSADGASASAAAHEPARGKPSTKEKSQSSPRKSKDDGP